MTLRTGAMQTRIEGSLVQSTGSVRWDCPCGRSFVDFHSSAELVIETADLAEPVAETGNDSDP